MCKPRLSILVLTLLPCFTSHAIPIPLPPAGSFLTEHFVSFDTLNGQFLQGQNLSLNFECEAGAFVRLYSITPEFSGILVLQTDAGTFPGFANGIGSILDSAGSQVLSLPLGAASSSSGALAAGLLLFGLPGPVLDVFGVRYEMSLPTMAGVQITSAELRFASRGKFGIGPGVPDTLPVPEAGGTALLLSLGVGALLLIPRVAKK